LAIYSKLGVFFYISNPRKNMKTHVSVYVVISLFSVFSKASSVGTCYGGGIVFYTSNEPNAPAGLRGLIVAINDVSDSQFVFDPSGNTEVRTSSSYFSGLDNTNNILNTTNNFPNSGDQTWPAAQAASEYSTTDTCPTCTPWYLPSQDELATLYFQSSNIENFWDACSGSLLSGNYWSSTQISTMAWYVNFDNGLVINYPTVAPFGVRAIRAF
jgi:hypothetical protein